MEENVRDPREDISYIKSILEKTADDMRSAAPCFLWFGVIWFVYGMLTAMQRIGLWFIPAPRIHWVSVGFTALNWAFYLVLAAGYLIVRRRLRRRGLDTLTPKLIDVWGVCILLFAALSVCLLVLIPRVWMYILPSPDFSTSRCIFLACAVAQGYLFFLLPAAPLLITSVFLEKRPMLWFGVGIAVIAAALLGCNTLLLFSGGLSIDSTWVWLSNAVACLLDLAPGVMLLLFSRNLKRG